MRLAISTDHRRIIGVLRSVWGRDSARPVVHEENGLARVLRNVLLGKIEYPLG